MSKYISYFLLGLIVGFAAGWLVFARPVDATTKKVWICHKPGKPAQKSLKIPVKAWPGHKGHGDHKGKCRPLPTATPTPTDVEPTPTEVEPTPTEFEPTPTEKPTPTEAPRRDPDPGAPPEWSDPCFYLADTPDCKTKDEVFPGEGATFGPQK